MLLVEECKLEEKSVYIHCSSGAWVSRLPRLILFPDSYCFPKQSEELPAGDDAGCLFQVELLGRLFPETVFVFQTF